jgi:hypothetical protein
MSSNLDCQFIHLRAGWYYLLEQEGSGEDWNAYGPFSSFEKAQTDFSDFASGDFWSDPADGPAREPTTWEAQHVARAFNPQHRNRPYQ